MILPQQFPDQKHLLHTQTSGNIAACCEHFSRSRPNCRKDQRDGFYETTGQTFSGFAALIFLS
jgi:hypothetical protein